MGVEAKFTVKCDARHGLCREETAAHTDPDHAVWEALELGWELDAVVGTWRCPIDHAKGAD